MKKIAIIFFFSIVISCLIVGCNDNSIQFKPESRFSNVMKDVQNQGGKPKVYNSSGVAIYKDQNSSNSNNGSGSNDLNFDLKVKF